MRRILNRYIPETGPAEGSERQRWEAAAALLLQKAGHTGPLQ